MKKILVISWFYPPVNSSEGLVTYKLLRNSKLRYDVCMQANSDCWSYGIEDDFPDAPNVRRIFSKSNTVNDWVDEITEFFRSHADDYDVVMTRSMPPESHKIGLNIKKIKPSIKWIASFGDPIANNPFVLKSIDAVSPFSLKMRYVRPMGLREICSPHRAIRNVLWQRQNKQTKALLDSDRTLETAILNSCDHVILNSEEQRNYMLGSFGDGIKQKAFVLPHSFDRELYSQKEKKPHDKIRIVYVGGLDDIRTPHAFLRALAHLKECVENLSDYVEVLFYGSLSDKEKLYLFEGDILDIVKVKKPVSYTESLSIMQDADWLLHVDANLSAVLDNNIFFAAKLADYIGAGSKIMGITMSEGPSAKILADINALMLSYSPEEIMSYLYLIIFNGYSVTMNTAESEKFDARNVATQFDKFVAEKVLTSAEG